MTEKEANSHKKLLNDWLKKEIPYSDIPILTAEEKGDFLRITTIQEIDKIYLTGDLNRLKDFEKFEITEKKPYLSKKQNDAMEIVKQHYLLRVSQLS